MKQFGASLTDDTWVVIYNCNTFIIQAIGPLHHQKLSESFMNRKDLFQLSIFYSSWFHLVSFKVSNDKYRKCLASKGSFYFFIKFIYLFFYFLLQKSLFKIEISSNWRLKARKTFLGDFTLLYNNLESFFLANMTTKAQKIHDL